MMQSSSWSERNLSELNEILELVKRTEQKIQELSSLAKDSTAAWRPNSEIQVLTLSEQGQV